MMLASRLWTSPHPRNPYNPMSIPSSSRVPSHSIWIRHEVQVKIATMWHRLLLCESGGDNLAANFSRELADYTRPALEKDFGSLLGLEKKAVMRSHRGQPYGQPCGVLAIYRKAGHVFHAVNEGLERSHSEESHLLPKLEEIP